MDHAKILAGQVASELVGLGGSADEVAAHLKASGIQGVRHTVRFLNPIVRYVQGRLHVDTVAVGLDVMEGHTLRLTMHDGQPIEVPLPQPVIDFLTAFNQAAYPDVEILQP